MPNGKDLDVIPPPSDVAPTNPDYRVGFGLVERPQSAQAEVPSEFLAEGLFTVPGVFQFREYAVDLVDGVTTEVELAGQTIDWAASEIQASGTYNYEFGVIRSFRLIGRVYSARQYTYLHGVFAIPDDGVTKSQSFTVRMKHF
jgi:hypothetical protein